MLSKAVEQIVEGEKKINQCQQWNAEGGKKNMHFLKRPADGRAPLVS